MISQNKIPLSTLRERLNTLTHDPDPETEFEAAFYMWSHYCLRHHIHSRQFFSQALHKGWIKREYADHFWLIITGENHF